MWKCKIVYPASFPLEYISANPLSFLVSGLGVPPDELNKYFQMSAQVIQGGTDKLHNVFFTLSRKKTVKGVDEAARRVDVAVRAKGRRSTTSDGGREGEGEQQ
jgi:hypothetical protein